MDLFEKIILWNEEKRKNRESELFSVNENEFTELLWVNLIRDTLVNNLQSFINLKVISQIKIEIW